MDDMTRLLFQLRDEAAFSARPGQMDRLLVIADGFEAAFAARDRLVAANAWDEGYNVGGHAASGDYSGIYGGNGQEPPNPYRITEENN